MPIWNFDTFARVIGNGNTIQPKVNPNVSIVADKEHLYINGMALPDGPGVTGQILQCGVTWLSWVDPPSIGGETGLPGPTGPAGAPQGETGIQGITGLPGVDGDQGYTGIRGMTGAQGYTGVRGMTGAQGYTGVRGHTGSQGETGIRGLDHAYTGAINFIMDGGIGYLVTGIKGDVNIPFDITIWGWDLYASETGFLSVNVYNDTYTNYPPNSSDTLVGATGLNLFRQIKNTGAASWWSDTTAAKNSIIRFNLQSVTGIKRCTVALKYSSL